MIVSGVLPPPGVATEATRDMSGLATIDGELIVPVAGQMLILSDCSACNEGMSPRFMPAWIKGQQ